MSSETAKLAGPHEIARLLGVSRQRVFQLASRPDFPAPVARLHMGSVWALDDVKAWAEVDGRTTY